MFFKRKKISVFIDKTQEKPVMKCSICTGEKIVGFENLKTKKFKEILCIKTEKDLKDFCLLYHLDENEIEKQW